MKILRLENMARLLEGQERTMSDKWTNDITEDFVADLNYMVEKRMPINIGINGFVGSSKSTLALSITDYLNQLQNNTMGLEYIAPDQSDFMEMVMHGTKENCTIAIDEYNVLLNTGYDATTFNALYKWYSDICAQKNTNRVSCAPSTIYDENCFIKLQITGKDTATKKTQALVNWRTTTDTSTTETPLGIVELSVKSTIDEKNTWHTKYRTLKFKRMDLLLKQGIRNMRELQFAEIIKATYDELKPICENVKITRGMIEGTMARIGREKKQFHSILTEMMLGDRIKGTIELERERRLLHRKLLMKKDEYKKGALTKIQKEIFEDQLNAYKKIKNTIEKEEAEMERLIGIKKEYDAIWKEGKLW